MQRLQYMEWKDKVPSASKLRPNFSSWTSSSIASFSLMSPLIFPVTRYKLYCINYIIIIIIIIILKWKSKLKYKQHKISNEIRV